jgi:hypothetical protein
MQINGDREVSRFSENDAENPARHRITNKAMGLLPCQLRVTPGGQQPEPSIASLGSVELPG